MTINPLGFDGQVMSVREIPGPVITGYWSVINGNTIRVEFPDKPNCDNGDSPKRMIICDIFDFQLSEKYFRYLLTRKQHGWLQFNIGYGGPPPSPDADSEEVKRIMASHTSYRLTFDIDILAYHDLFVPFEDSEEPEETDVCDEEVSERTWTYDRDETSTSSGSEYCDPRDLRQARINYLLRGLEPVRNLSKSDEQSDPSFHGPTDRRRRLAREQEEGN